MESSAAKQQSMAGANVITAEQKYLRTELEQRRTRLHEALHSPGADATLSELLTAVDTALTPLKRSACWPIRWYVSVWTILQAPNNAPWRAIFPWLRTSSALSCQNRA